MLIIVSLIDIRVYSAGAIPGLGKCLSGSDVPEGDTWHRHFRCGNVFRSYGKGFEAQEIPDARKGPSVDPGFYYHIFSCGLLSAGLSSEALQTRQYGYRKDNRHGTEHCNAGDHASAFYHIFPYNTKEDQGSGMEKDAALGISVLCAYLCSCLHASSSSCEDGE